VPEADDLTFTLTTVGAALMDELIGRLDANLSEKDLTAIATAISKATLRGANVVAASVPNVQVHVTEPEEVDFWADTYGAEAGSS
jgi:hypothetical protein